MAYHECRRTLHMVECGRDRSSGCCVAPTAFVIAEPRIHHIPTNIHRSHRQSIYHLPAYSDIAYKQKYASVLDKQQLFATYKNRFTTFTAVIANELLLSLRH